MMRAAVNSLRARRAESERNASGGYSHTVRIRLRCPCRDSQSIRLRELLKFLLQRGVGLLGRGRVTRRDGLGQLPELLEQRADLPILAILAVLAGACGMMMFMRLLYAVLEPLHDCRVVLLRRRNVPRLQILP